MPVYDGFGFCFFLCYLSQVAFFVIKERKKSELLETEPTLKTFLRANKQKINHLINKHVQALNNNNKKQRLKPRGNKCSSKNVAKCPQVN